MKKAGLLFLFVVCTFVFLSGQSYTVESVPNPQEAAVPGYVCDPDNYLSSETIHKINVQIDSLQRINNTELAVVILHSIGTNEENQFANRLFNHWGIGGKTQNNGVLLLIVMDTKRLVIRTGAGVEGILPDIVASRIISRDITPHFKDNNYNAGVEAGVNQIIRVVREEDFVKEEREAVNWKEAAPYAAILYIIFILLTLYWISDTVKKINKNKALSTNLARYVEIKNQNRASYAIASLLVPFIAFFIIIFTTNPEFILALLPAPVAALPAYFYGRMKMNHARRASIPCGECGSHMRMLSDKEEKAYLKLSQQFEEQLNSIDYDVFLCEECNNQAIFSLDKLNTYTRCPRCNTKAYHLHSKKTVLMPTYLNAGTQRSTYKCKFCGFDNHHDTKIPRLTRSAAFTGGAVGGSVYSGRGGFGGGGFGGGFSSGGGASGGW